MCSWCSQKPFVTLQVQLVQLETIIYLTIAVGAVKNPYLPYQVQLVQLDTIIYLTSAVGAIRNPWYLTIAVGAR